VGNADATLTEILGPLTLASEEQTVPVDAHLPGHLQSSDLRPLTRAAFSFLILSSGDLCDPVSMDEEVVIKRKRGYGGAGWDMPAKQPHRLRMTFGRPLRSILVQRLPTSCWNKNHMALPELGVWPERSAFHAH